MNSEEVDYELTSKMVDYFIQQGFNYFDTAHGYLGGKSEIALKECLTSRYPRNQYIPNAIVATITSMSSFRKAS